MNANRISRGLPFADYLAHPALSASGVKRILVSPAHFRVPLTDTKALADGRLIHRAILEPESYGQTTVVLPQDAPTKPTARQRNAKKPSPDTLTAIDWWDAWEREAAGRDILSTDDRQQHLDISGAVRSHPAAARLLADGEAEVSLFWQHAEHDVPCKARFDWWRASDRILVDIKTTVDASPAGFAKQVARYQYHAQAAMYHTAAEHLFGEAPSAFVFIAVEKEPPYAVGVYALDAEAISKGHALVDQAATLYRQCLAADRWPGYPDTIQTLTLPAWA